MSRNYFEIEEPIVYLDLKRDACKPDFEPESGEHPHFILDPSPSLSVLEATIEATERAEKKRGNKKATKRDRLMAGFHQIALVATELRGNGAFHRNGPIEGSWPCVFDGGKFIPGAFDKRMNLLKELTRNDIMALQYKVTDILDLSEDEVKNSSGE